MPPKYSQDIAALFKPRPRLRFIKPDSAISPKPYKGCMAYIQKIQNIDVQPLSDVILPTNEARIQRRMQRIAANQQRLDEQIARYKPNENINATKNPKTTLFIYGIPESVRESAIRYELKVFGPLRSVKFPVDTKTGKRKNYCFVEYEREDSFRNAMLQGTKLYFEGKKMIVDKERARTEPNWLPRRLGGGIDGLARRFVKKSVVMQSMNRIKKRKFGFKCGTKYRGTMIGVHKDRERAIGITRKTILQQIKRKRMNNQNPDLGKRNRRSTR